MRAPLPDHRWAQIEALFLAAVELPAGSRESFLEDACGSNQELREEVLSLLRCDLDAPDLLDAVQAGAASVVQEERIIGRVLGPYRIERELGRGGMAVVCLGVRADGQFHKKVAIKLIKRGMDTAAVIERLRRERRILAALDHPYIAHLLDGGSTTEGLPYFVMDYVEGLPIDLYCDTHGLGIQQRCELIAKVCDAVAYAHRKLVVHRDLKPANILIAADGSPKLLDFGLAKILDADPDGSETVHTHPRPLTPEYASPEQVRGRELTTATDVYSLGVILYELLSGVRPFRLPSATPAEWEKAICESAPPRPSAAGGSRRRALEGDLDNIVLKAMHKDAERRYASVDEVAADLRRYLTFRPVLARQDSVWYRSAKFVRRRKFPLLAATAILASLIAGMVVSISLARKAQAAREIAVARQVEAERARKNAEVEHQRADQEKDVAVAAQERSEERLAQIIQLSDRSLSNVYTLLERLPGAVPARKEMIEATLGLLESLSKDARSNPGLRAALAKAYLRLGDLQGGPDAVSMANFMAAIPTYRAGVALLEQTPLAEMTPEQATIWLELKRKMGRLVGQRDAPRATAVLLETLAQSAKLPPAQLADLEFARSRAALFLAIARVNHIDLPRAHGYATAYLNATTGLMRQHPDDAGLRYDLSVAQVELAWVLLSGGDPEIAADYYQKAIQIRERLVAEFPGDTLYRRALMLSYEHFADVQGGPIERNLGNPRLARLYYQKARPMVETAVSDPQNLDGLASYASALIEGASVDITGNPEDSIAALRKAVSIWESMPVAPSAGPGGVWIANAYRLLGDRMAGKGDHAAALAEYQHALTVANELLLDHPDRDSLRHSLEAEAGIAAMLSALHDRAGALEHAAKLLQRAGEGTRHGGDAGLVQSWTAQGEMLLAKVHRDFEEWAPAQEAAEEALKLARPFSNNRAWDSNTKVVRAAQELIAECSSKVAGGQQ